MNRILDQSAGAGFETYELVHRLKSQRAYNPPQAMRPAPKFDRQRKNVIDRIDRDRTVRSLYGLNHHQACATSSTVSAPRVLQQ